jgi:DnaA family protein
LGEPRDRVSPSAAPNQLPLALALPAHARLETFVAGPNHAAVRHVAELADGRAETLWLWGGRGCGKTHLLQAACRAADRAGRRAMYVLLEPNGAVAPDLLGGLDALDLLALDRVESVAGNDPWERALFTVLNAFAGGHGALLLAAGTAPAAAGFRLPDLASRAAGAVIYRLEPLDDADRVTALLAHAGARGLELERAAAEYLHHRVARDMFALVAWLDRLDRASLAAQRRITVPFVREQLAAATAARD